VYPFRKSVTAGEGKNPPPALPPYGGRTLLFDIPRRSVYTVTYTPTGKEAQL